MGQLILKKLTSQFKGGSRRIKEKEGGGEGMGEKRRKPGTVLR